MKCTDNSQQPSMYTEREWLRIQEKEKSDARKQRRLILAAAALFLLTALLAFLVYYFVLRSHDYTLFEPYSRTDGSLGVGGSLRSDDIMEPFADKLCVVNGDVNLGAVSLSAYSAGVFDLNGRETIYAQDVFARRSPASITKIMTALLTLKYGNLDDIVTVTPIVKEIEFGSSVCDIKEGDVLSLEQLLYGMMIASGNDAAMMIAEHIGGSVENFVAMMNEEAAALGATGTHFMNPHGLTDPNHYTSVYDIYLMLNAALKYDIFQDIISRRNYYAEYTRIDGSPAAVTWESTNSYFTKAAEQPEGITISGGKTGTTDDAGACLAIVAKDRYGNPYIAVILHSDTKETLYPEMNELLGLIES